MLSRRLDLDPFGMDVPHSVDLIDETEQQKAV